MIWGGVFYYLLFLLFNRAFCGYRIALPVPLRTDRTDRHRPPISPVSERWTSEVCYSGNVHCLHVFIRRLGHVSGGRRNLAVQDVLRRFQQIKR